MQSKRIEAFVDRYPLVGPIFWMASIQYYVVQIVVARAWPIPYSWMKNQISDLGNTACGQYSGRYVCSPLHALMNHSFIMLGLAMIIGAVLIYHEFRASRGTAVGFGFMALAGIGTLLVGLFPENVNVVAHTLGASLAFVLGNISLIVLGFSLELPPWLKYYTVGSGVISLAALGLAETHTYLGLGAGGMERVIAFPQSIWLMVFGVYMSKNRFVRLRDSKVH